MQQAPDFTLQDQTGRPHSLSDYLGKWVVLYFYPKDDTPGCTTEACSFRDARDDLADLHAEIIGISKDSLASHEDFVAKHKLNFALLSDPDLKVINMYGAWGSRFLFGQGVLRKTVIIDPSGNIVKTFDRATPLGHGQQVVAALKALQE